MSLPDGGGHSYTLVVMTYDRSPLLSRLLDYLEREGADFPVVVLDSSHDEARRANADRIARSALSVRQVVYSTDLHPYLKVKEGVRLVQTDYCSVCADDDLVLLPALRSCLRLLGREPETCVAHGIYFNFSEGRSLDLSYIVYSGPSLLADDPLVRLKEMFAAYEAVFYGVYRTPVLQAVFRRVGELQTALGRELVTAALTAVSGKIVRIDEFYYGRSTGQSLFYEDWHPHQILVASPEILMQEYRVLREIVLEAVLPAPGEARRRDFIETILDLIFLRYLGPFLRFDVLGLIIDDRLKGMSTRAVVEHLWDVFVRSTRATHRIEPLTGRDGGGFAPDLFKEEDTHTDFVFRATTAWDAPRTYTVFYEFLFPDLKPPAVVGKQKLLALLDRLNSY